MSTTRKLRHYNYQQQTPTPYHHHGLSSTAPHTMDSAMATATTTANQTTKQPNTFSPAPSRITAVTLLSVMCHTTQHSTPTEFHTDQRGCKNRTLQSDTPAVAVDLVKQITDVLSHIDKESACWHHHQSTSHHNRRDSSSQAQSRTFARASPIHWLFAV